MAGKKGRSGKGAKTPEHRAAMSAALKKMYAKMNAAQRKKQLAAAHKVGGTWSAERRAAQSKRLRGKKLSAEHRAKVSAGLRRHFAAKRAKKGKD